jgi:hypothetical protein
MNDDRLDDELLVAVRDARPASSGLDTSPFSPAAEKILERALSARELGRNRRRGHADARWLGWVVPIVASMSAITVLILALADLGHRHPTNSSVGSAAAHGLSDAQYVLALGGDPSPSTGTLLLFRADQLLRAQCMQQRGFHYVLDPTPTAGLSGLPTSSPSPSTFYPEPSVTAYAESKLLAFRAIHGFGIYGGAVAPHTDPDPDDRYLKTLPRSQQRRWLNAWTGKDGCYGTAEAQLYDSRRAANMAGAVPTLVYNYLDNIVYDHTGAISTRDRRTATAASAWSQCMQRATGHVWSDENALITWLLDAYTPRQTRTRTFRQLEIHQAISDTHCSYSTGQAQTFAAAFRQAANHLPAQIESQLRFVLTHRLEWIAQARTILSGSHT